MNESHTPVPLCPRFSWMAGILFLVLLLVLSPQSQATGVGYVSSDGLYRYTLSYPDNSPFGQATITYYYGIGMTDVSIPSALGGYPVTGIGDYAFEQKNLTSVTIPSSVTSIGAGAFDSCPYLSSATISSGVTSIGDYAFAHCASLSSVSIPNSVVSVGVGAFYNCTVLNSAIIPNSVTSIGDNAFYNCTGLSSVAIPNGVTSIGSSAFYNCTSLSGVTIPSSVTNLGASAFYNCASLGSAIFDGNAPAQIGAGVFDSAANNFTVYFYAGTTGFSAPTWDGYNSSVKRALHSLQLSAGALSPSFAPGQSDYTVVVDNVIDRTTVTATTGTDSTIQVRVNGGAYAPLQSGGTLLMLNNLGDSNPNLVEVRCSTLDGSFTMTYSINVIRATVPGSAVAQTGALAASKFVAFGTPAINESQDVAFQAIASGTAAKALRFSAIYEKRGSAGTVTQLARSGDLAPDHLGTTGLLGKFATFSDPVLNNNDDLAFFGTLKGSAISQGIWARRAGVFALLAAKGQVITAPDQPAGAKFASLDQVILPDRGGPVFRANLAVGGAVTAKNNQGFWAMDINGNLMPIVRTGDVVGGGTIASLSLLASPAGVGGQTRSYNGNGDLAFKVNFTNRSQGVLVLPFYGTAQEIATARQAAPGVAGAAFSAFGSPIINELGHVAFWASLSGSSITKANNAGIWMQSGDGGAGSGTMVLNKVACTGDAVPVTSGTALASGTFAALSEPVCNNQDDLAFIGSLAVGGVVSKSNSQGIWLRTGSTGALSQVVQAQDLAADCAGAKFASFAQITLPDSGGVIVLANLTGTGVKSGNNQGIWVINSNGQSTLLVRKGDVIVDQLDNPKTVASLAIFSATAGVNGQSRSFSINGNVAYKVTFTDKSQEIYEVPSGL